MQCLFLYYGTVGSDGGPRVRGESPDGHRQPGLQSSLQPPLNIW